MSNNRLIFKFKPSIDVENEYASSEQFISAYFEGIHMLLGEKSVRFNNPEDALFVTYNGDYWQVTSLCTPEGSWDDTIVELTVQNKNKKQILRISTDMIGDEDAWKLLKAVFEKTGYNDYKDVYDFYGYELS